MNNANAAAKKRRANIQPEPVRPPVGSPVQPPPVPQNGLTLQQVVLLTDQRLTILESFMNKLSEKNATMTSSLTPENGTANSKEIIENMDEMFDDANRKFEILAEEITQLKDIVMKLQSYTMEVNKVLLDKLNALDGSPVPSPPSFTENNPTTDANANNTTDTQSQLQQSQQNEPLNVPMNSV